MMKNKRIQTEATSPKLSHNPAKALQQTMQAIDALCELYKQENQALDNHDIRGFSALQAKKNQVLDLYKNHVLEIINRKAEMKTADVKIREAIKAKQAQFHELAHYNQTALERMKRVTERLGNTIQHAAKEEFKKEYSINYSPNGALEDDKRRVSIGLNESA